MDWIQVKITTTKEGIDPVCGVLLNLGIEGVQISDKDDFAEFLEENRNYWDYVDETLEELKEADTEVTLYLSDDALGLEEYSSVKNAMSILKNSSNGLYGELKVSSEHVKDEDWSENWKKYFKPIPVGEKILIQPEWDPIKDDTDRIVFTVNPGMSFGTGSHPSTRFCIEELEKYVSGGEEVLDLGCGSGILSVIALLLGAKHVDAVDIDPKAVDVTYENLERNNLPKDKISGMAGDATSDTELRKKLGKYDIVLANIVADVILALAEYVPSLLKESGVFICSGIIDDRCDEVEEGLKKAGLDIISVRTANEWSVICAKKRL